MVKQRVNRIGTGTSEMLALAGIQTIFISERFFTKEELSSFRKEHGYEIKEISYSSIEGEIDFSVPEQKEFLFKYGTPKILARFGY